MRNFRLIGPVLLLAISLAIIALPAQAAKRVALVIGNSDYQNATPLKNPKNDALAIAKSLDRFGFDVVMGTNLQYAALREKVEDFSKRLKGADVGLLFFAGHGLQADGSNYLVPTDAKLDSLHDVRTKTIELRNILSRMRGMAKTNLVFLDACRDNPFVKDLSKKLPGSRSTRVGRGLAAVDFTPRVGLADEGAGAGTLIAFAAEPGKVAFDGNGKNSPFTTGLLQHIGAPGVDVALVMRKVRVAVMRQTKNTQIPWSNSSLTDTFIFNRDEDDGIGGVRSAEGAYWQAAEASGSASLFRSYLDRYPDGIYSYEARARMADLTPTGGPSLASGSELGEKDMALLLQAQLTRVRCNPGSIDGDWGPNSRSALARFNQHASASLPTAAPSLDAIEAIIKKENAVCPLPKATQPVAALPQNQPKAGSQKKKTATRNSGRTAASGARVPEVCKTTTCKSVLKRPNGSGAIITTTPMPQW